MLFELGVMGGGRSLLAPSVSRFSCVLLDTYDMRNRTAYYKRRWLRECAHQAIFTENGRLVYIYIYIYHDIVIISPCYVISTAESPPSTAHISQSPRHSILCQVFVRRIISYHTVFLLSFLPM